MTHGFSLWDKKHIRTQSGHMTFSSQCGGAKWLDTNQHRHSCTMGGLSASCHFCPFSSYVKRLQQKTTVGLESFLCPLLDHCSKLNLSGVLWECLIVCHCWTGVHADLSLLSHSLGCFVSVSWNVNMAWFLWSAWVEKYSRGLISVQTNG